jgi:hypothetical protein
MTKTDRIKKIIDKLSEKREIIVRRFYIDGIILCFDIRVRGYFLRSYSDFGSYKICMAFSEKALELEHSSCKQRALEFIENSRFFGEITLFKDLNRIDRKEIFEHVDEAYHKQLTNGMVKEMKIFLKKDLTIK